MVIGGGLNHAARGRRQSFLYFGGEAPAALAVRVGGRGC